MLALSSLPESKHELLSQLTQNLEPHDLSWLAGYFTGLAGQDVQLKRTTPVLAPAATSSSALRQLTIIYGSQTGNAKRVAESLAERSEAAGLPTRLVRADRYVTKELKDEQLVYVVMSTQGEGEPPDDSIGFVEFLSSRRAPKLPLLRYAILGLGDSSYPSFCGIAETMDSRLAELGAKRLQDWGAADLDIDSVATPWTERALDQAREAFKQSGSQPSASVTPLHPAGARVTREQPFQAELLLNQPITGATSSKDIRHIEISLEGSHLNYQPGDSLGVWPTQASRLVDDVLKTLGFDADEMIESSGTARTLRQWLTHHRELTQLTKPFLVAHAKAGQCAELDALSQPDQKETFRELIETHQLIDILKRYPARWTSQGFVDALRPMTPRLYSIASSQSEVGEEVHLTVAHVAYEHDGEQRWGAASHFLSHISEGDTVPVFLEENARFRLPADGTRDIIMVGPGTGIAPFRAFIQERRVSQASGRNWLFFGNPHFSTDFLYQTEWQRALEDDVLQRIDLSFSRDQEAKIYVQDRLREQAAHVYDWLQGGAYLYVCGDATRMARDVHEMLVQIAQDEGGLDASQAKQWLDELAAQGRYARDVY